MPIEPPSIERREPHLVMATWRDLYFEVWRGRGTPGDIRDTYRFQAEFAKRLATTIVCLSVVHEAAMGKIDPEVRRVVDEESALVRPHLRARSMVLLTMGFGGAILRSLITGVDLVKRPKYPTKTAATVHEAAVFLAPFVGGGPFARASSAELIEAVQAAS